MGTAIDLLILSSYLSGGELKQLKRIADKPQPTKGEINFILAMSSRTFKKVRRSISADQVEIRLEGTNFIITTK